MLIGSKFIAQKNGKFYKYFGKSYWMLLYHYNSNKENAFTPENVLFSNKNDKYSILGILDDSYKEYGKFEFLLEYPSLNLRNQWLQSINPIITEETTGNGSPVLGYQPISVNMTTQLFGGLIKSSTIKLNPPLSFLDGSTHHTNWYYSIGTYNLYSDRTYPGPSETQQVYESALWIKVNPSICSYQHIRNNKNLRESIIILVLVSQ